MSPKTITEALHPHRLSPTALTPYAPFHAMTTHLLGSPPSFYPLLALSPAGIRTHTGLFARFFHCPAVDLRLPTFPSPAVRRAAFLAASRAANCTYCTAHAAAFGDLLQGSIPAQLAAGRPVHCKPTDDAERVAAALAALAAARPPPSPSALADAVHEARKVLGARGCEVVASVAAFAGALNTVMDVQGVELEPGVQRFAEEHMEDWSAGVYHGYAGVGEEVPEAPGGLLGLVGVMPAAMSGMAKEFGDYYWGVPVTGEGAAAWVEERIGAAAWVRAVQGTEVRRAFCFGLRENLFVPGEGEIAGFPWRREWDFEERVRFLWVFGSVAGSEYLREVAVGLLAESEGLGAEEAKAVLRDFEGAEVTERLTAGRRLVVAEGTRFDNIGPDLVDEVTTRCSPEAVIELASLLSFFELWRRMSLLFALELV